MEPKALNVYGQLLFADNGLEGLVVVETPKDGKDVTLTPEGAENLAKLLVQAAADVRDKVAKASIVKGQGITAHGAIVDIDAAGVTKRAATEPELMAAGLLHLAYK